MNRPTPAIVTQLAARRLPRLMLWLLCLAYVLPGLLGRQPWRHADLASFGVMLDMAQGSGDWLHPQVLGQAAEVPAWLPYWLGAIAIKGLPFLTAELAVRIPFGFLLVTTLACTWYAMYHLARLPAAQPVTFAFGGEALPVDYARAMADTALLALIASLGLALLSHEVTPDATQLTCSALLLNACARLASPAAKRRWLSTLLWWLGAVGLALSGAPWLGLILGSGWLLWTPFSQVGRQLGTQRVGMWLFCATGTLLTGLLAWELELPRRLEVWGGFEIWIHLKAWRTYGQLLLWFSWPAGILALWTIWRWRQRLDSAHVLLPLWFALAGLVSAWLLGANDRAMLMALPGLACLAAFALPTLSRSVTALIDWFALLFFTGCAAIIWLHWLAMVTGTPAKPAANVFRLVPGFTAQFRWWEFIPAILATLAWIGVLVWRMGRHRAALWKSLALSAVGSTLCWTLIMTLWLPVLNYGMGLEPVAHRIATALPRSGCVLVHGLNQAQITGLQYHGQLVLERLTPKRSSSCRSLVVHPSAYVSLPQSVDMTQWRLLSKFPRLRENRDSLMVFERR